MREIFTYIFIVLLMSCFIANTAFAKRWGKRKMAGQYTFAAGSLFNGTAVLAKDKSTSKLPNTTNAHSVVGKWKLKKHKQRVTIDWPDMASFEGYVVDLDTITGQYIDVDANIAACTLNRITNGVDLFHLHITRTRNRRVKGNTFFNYGKDIKRRLYKVAVYSRMSGDVARISYTPEHAKKSKLHRLGFFNREIKGDYDYAECFLISKLFDPPEESTDFPALAIDGTNVFAYDWQEPGFKWFDWSVTNYY